MSSNSEANRHGFDAGCHKSYFSSAGAASLKRSGNTVQKRCAIGDMSSARVLPSTTQQVPLVSTRDQCHV